tara:strand:+ start:698 stop:844 length:147 start_codon:yes stop_codon:yes gene_type:complete
MMWADHFNLRRELSDLFLKHSPHIHGQRLNRLAMMIIGTDAEVLRDFL